MFVLLLLAMPFLCSFYRGTSISSCHCPVQDIAPQQLKFRHVVSLCEGLYCFHDMYQICHKNLDQNQSWLSQRNRKNIKELTVERQKWLKSDSSRYACMWNGGRMSGGGGGWDFTLLVNFLIRAVKPTQQSQRIVSTRRPPVGLPVLRFTVASLSCRRQQHLSPSVWALRHFPGI